MAFKFKASDPRGEPRIQLIGGRFEVLPEYYSHPKRVKRARKYCEQINRGIPRITRSS